MVVSLGDVRHVADVNSFNNGLSLMEELSKGFMRNAVFGEEPNWAEPFLALYHVLLLLELLGLW